ncbi:MAG: hypothetical protein PHW46_02705 [Candidatus Omnitrophica bacterium]|nr:hypothetical protein [Candidatus Omnitrophota bacterium]
MKRYLQACEIGGSLYGKAKSSRKAGYQRKKENKEDLISSYSSFYKKQYEVFNKVFRGQR